MSKKIFIYEYKLENRNNDEKQLDEEYLRDGIKGISFKYFKLSKGKKESFFKLSGKELEDGSFGITVRQEEKTDEQTLNKKDFIAFLKKHKELGFVTKYIEKDMEKFRKSLNSDNSDKGGKLSKKTKKVSKKKTSKKKTSKKKTSKKKTSKKKASKKKTKTASKKTSKKKSRK